MAFSSMDLGFSGKPPMGGASTRGSSGVPPTSGGRVSAPPMGSPPGIGRGPTGGVYGSAFSRFLNDFQRQLNRYGGAYAALAGLDPNQTRRAAQRADAYLGQYLPSWYYKPGWWNKEGWATQGKAAGGDPYAPYRQGLTDAGFTQNCVGIQISGRPYHKMGWPNQPESPCNNNGNFFTPGALVGDDIPAGIVWVQFGSSLSNEPPPSQFGWVEEKWKRSSGTPSTTSVKYKVGYTMPLPVSDPWADPWPETQMETSYGSKTAPLGAIAPYQRSSTDTVVDPGGISQGPPGGGVHNQLPPPRGTREKKAKANYGAAGRAYGVVTEVQDFSDCLVKAIKQGAKDAGKHLSKAPGRWDPRRALWIAQNAANTDMGTLVECFAVQHVTDDLMGAASRNIDRRFREGGYLNGLRGINGGRPSGFATGPHQQSIQNALNHARIR